jgi:hypothetical protein
MNVNIEKLKVDTHENRVLSAAFAEEIYVLYEKYEGGSNKNYTFVQHWVAWSEGRLISVYGDNSETIGFAIQSPDGENLCCLWSIHKNLKLNKEIWSLVNEKFHY